MPAGFELLCLLRRCCGVCFPPGTVAPTVAGPIPPRVSDSIVLASARLRLSWARLRGPSSRWLRGGGGEGPSM
eukprot:6488079-Prymnesium_polylepis.1